MLRKMGWLLDEAAVFDAPVDVDLVANEIYSSWLQVRGRLVKENRDLRTIVKAQKKLKKK